MKVLSLFLCLMTLTTFSAQAEERVDHEITVSISLNGLRCLAFVGERRPLEERFQTILGGEESWRKLTILFAPEGSIELDHSVALMSGCPIEILDELAERATMGFSFLHNIPTTVERVIFKPFVNGFGKCIQRIEENLEIRLDEQVVLKSQQATLKDSEECF